MRLFISAALSVFYLTRVLLFEEKQSHFGPFPQVNKYVQRIKSHYTQPVTLFDYVRRFTLNPYSVEKIGDGEELWYVDEGKMERWTCPKCLSFWIALAVGVVYALFVERPRSLRALVETGFFILSLAGATTFLSSIYDGLQDGMQLRSDSKSSPQDPHY